MHKDAAAAAPGSAEARFTATLRPGAPMSAVGAAVDAANPDARLVEIGVWLRVRVRVNVRVRVSVNSRRTLTLTLTRWRTCAGCASGSARRRRYQIMGRD